MKSRLQLMVTVPVLGAALISLVRDESLESFIKKVLITWIFFSIAHAFVTAMWKIAAPRPEPRELAGRPRGNEHTTGRSGPISDADTPRAGAANESAAPRAVTAA